MSEKKENIFENLDQLILTSDDDNDDFDPTKEVKEVADESKDNDDSKDDDKPDDLNKGKKKPKDDGRIDVSELFKKEDTTEVDDKSKTSEPEDQTEILKAWADEFKDKTILNEEDLKEFNGTFESLVDSMNKMKTREGLEMVEDYKSQLPQVLKALAENWEEGVPLDELINIKSNQMRYSGIDEKELEEKPETQKAVVTEYLRKTTKFSETKISKEVERLLDLDELKDEAIDGLKELKKFESEAEDVLKKETKKQRELRTKENEKIISEYNKTAKSIKEVIPGIKIDEKTIEKMLKHTIDPIGVDGNGNPVSYIQSLRAEDPYNFDLKLNYIMEITKGLTDFSKIENTVKTKATSEIFNKLDNQRPKATKNDSGVSGEKKNIIDYLKMPVNKKLN